MIFSVRNKKLLWIILIWFALLQMLSPLIHAHVEIDVPNQGQSQGHGPHVHMDEVTAILEAAALNTAPAFKDFSASVHTIGVDKARVKKVELLPAPLFTLLFAIFSLMLVTRLIKVKPKFRFLFPLPFYLKSQSRPRAPPYF
jgi:hypothetical protein